MNIDGALRRCDDDDDDLALRRRRRGSVLQKCTDGRQSTSRDVAAAAFTTNQTVAVDDRDVRRPENAPAKSIEERLKLRIAGLSGTMREVTAEKHLVEQERDALKRELEGSGGGVS